MDMLSTREKILLDNLKIVRDYVAGRELGLAKQKAANAAMTVIEITALNISQIALAVIKASGTQ